MNYPGWKPIKLYKYKQYPYIVKMYSEFVFNSIGSFRNKNGVSNGSQ